MTRRLSPAFLLGLALTACASSEHSPAAPATLVGERHTTIPLASAAFRDAEHRAELRLTIWHPAAPGSPLTSIDMGPPGAPLFRVGSVAMNAPFADGGRHPVILLSHGFGGSARMMAWFATAMAARGYVVVGVDHPGNNGVDAMTMQGSLLWWERAEDLKAALAAVLAEPALAPHIDPKRIGVAGFSLGGFTALVAGGARADPDNGLAFCRAHPDEGSCQPQPEFPVTIADAYAALRSEEYRPYAPAAGADHALPGVRAVFAMAPVVPILSPASLKAMRLPVAIVVGDRDPVVPAVTHAQVAANLIPGATLTLAAGATHYSYLSECTDAGRASVPICKTASAQAATHAQAIDLATALFDRALK